MTLLNATMVLLAKGELLHSSANGVFELRHPRLEYGPIVYMAAHGLVFSPNGLAAAQPG